MVYGAIHQNERQEHMNRNMLYRSIPKVDVLLQDESIREMIEQYSREAVMESVHIEMDRSWEVYCGQ